MSRPYSIPTSTFLASLSSWSSPSASTLSQRLLSACLSVFPLLYLLAARWHPRKHTPSHPRRKPVFIGTVRRKQPKRRRPLVSQYLPASTSTIARTALLALPRVSNFESKAFAGPCPLPQRVGSITTTSNGQPSGQPALAHNRTFHPNSQSRNLLHCSV